MEINLPYLAVLDTLFRTGTLLLLFQFYVLGSATVLGIIVFSRGFVADFDIENIWFYCICVLVWPVMLVYVLGIVVRLLGEATLVPLKTIYVHLRDSKTKTTKTTKTEKETKKR